MKLTGIVYQLLNQLKVPITTSNVSIVTKLIHSYRDEILRTYKETHEREDLGPIPSSLELHGGYFDRYRDDFGGFIKHFQD